jgi:hypothetical protein
VNTDVRAVAECLLTAHYSEHEIVDYLMGPFGLAEDEAMSAVRDAGGGRHFARLRLPDPAQGV